MTLFIIGCPNCHSTTGCVAGKMECSCEDCELIKFCDMQDEEPDIKTICKICLAREKFFAGGAEI